MEVKTITLKPGTGDDTWDASKAGELYFGLKVFICTEWEAWLSMNNVNIHYNEALPSRPYLFQILKQVEEGLLKNVTLTVSFDDEKWAADGTHRRELEYYCTILGVEIDPSNFPEIEYKSEDYEHLGTFGEF